MSSLGAADEYPSSEVADSGEDLVEKRKLKYTLREVISTFNEKPRESIKMMNDLRLIESESDYQGIVKILRKSRALINKKTLGLFLADKSQNSPSPFILKELMDEFEFKAQRIDQALRILMHDIRLPGEGQQIERILDAFADSYFRQNPQDKTFKDADSACILSYAIIMLNTDQHSQQLRTRDRMNLEAFVKNVSKCNKGEDFPRDFLQSIYDAIRTQEIIVPEEHDGDLGFSYLWSDVLKKNIDNITIEASTKYLKQIVVLVWDPLLETIIRGKFPSSFLVFESELQSQDAVLMPLMDATNALAKIAYLSSSVDNNYYIDTLIKNLWQVSNISNMYFSQSGNLVPRYLCKIETGRELIRSFLTIFKKYGEHVKGGWNELVEFLLIAADSGILVMTDSIVSGDPISALHRNSMKKRAASPGVQEGSFFSTITSYFAGGTSHPASPADNAPGSAGDDYRGRAGDFLSSCKLEDIFVETKLFSLGPLMSLLKALISPIMTSGKKHRTDSLVLLIDLAVYCALQNRDRLGELWPLLFEGFSSISGSAQVDLSLSLREHAALAIGKLALKAAERPELQNHLLDYLQLLCQIPPDFFLNIAEPSLAIIIHMLETPKSGLLQDERIWPHYFTILSLVSRLKHCAAMTLTLLAAVSKVPNFPFEFFGEFLELTRDFCTMLGTLEEADLKGSVIESTPIEMGTKTIKVLQNLLEKTKREEEILVVLSQQCLHPIKEVTTTGFVCSSKVCSSFRY